MKVKLYKDGRGEIRWDVAGNGRIQGAATEGYKRRRGAINNMIKLRDALNRVDLEKLQVGDVVKLPTRSETAALDVLKRRNAG